jgi:glycosyltransferase involved in cell wall biosynthesis
VHSFKAQLVRAGAYLQQICGHKRRLMQTMRLVAYTDYVYRASDGVVYAERAFALFLAAVGSHCEELTIVGRLAPTAGPARYALPAATSFVALPHYHSVTHPGALTSSLMRSVVRFYRALDRADAVWLFGPSPHAIAFAVVTWLRRRKLVLGVRQDYPSYVRSRHPNRRPLHAVADALEWMWRTIARRCPVVAVGPDLARNYAAAPRLLPITVSLVSQADVEAGERAAARAYDGTLTLLSVGRIDHEKNPLLLAEAFAKLHAEDRRWRLLVCGEGPLKAELQQRLDALGVGADSELAGYLPIHEGLLERYRSSHVFLHVSWTEGLPQVLIEAFASGVPVVATAVGGVPEALGDGGLLIPPGDAGAAVAAVSRLAADPELRQRLVRSGFAEARAHTLEAESARVAEFISA